MKNFLLTPFRYGNTISKGLLALFFIINAIVATNAVIHHPMIGYDAVGHLRYFQAMAEFRLATSQDTKEFFSPPLPYVIPALAYTLIRQPCEAAGIGITWNISDIVPPCIVVAGKFGQLQNVFFSLGLTFYLLKICDIIYPSNISFKTMSLLLLGILPVYYKTFAFIRGEPVLAFLTVVVTYHVLALVSNKKSCNIRNMLTIGLALGLVLLSRQWGFALVPALAIFTAILFIQQGKGALPVIKTIGGAFLIAALVAGWFYIALKWQEGSSTAFNRQPAKRFALSNQPLDFYIGTGDGKLFANPLRPSFANQFIPTFYTEMWGDYWCYFTVTGCGKRRGFDETINNMKEMQPYLARVNLVSLFPTLIMTGGLIVGMAALFAFFRVSAPSAKTTAYAFFQLIILISFAGYFWFLISYPRHGNGDTIKATYMLQVFPLLVIMSISWIQDVQERFVFIYHLMVTFLVIMFLHNIPAMITKYIFLG